MQKWHWQKCNNSITAQKVLGCVIFYFYVIPFNNAIAAVCPIEVHDSQPMFWNYWGLHEPLDCPGSNIKECHNSFSLWHCTELNSTTCSNFWEKAIKGRVTWKDKRTELLEQKLTRKWAGLFTTVFPPPSWLTAQIVFWSSDLYFILISYLSPELYYILITSSLGSLVYFFYQLLMTSHWFLMIPCWTWLLLNDLSESNGRSLLAVSTVSHQWGGSRNIPPVADGKKEKVSKMAAWTCLSAGKQ